jgi:hypothetical protein
MVDTESTFGRDTDEKSGQEGWRMEADGRRRDGGGENAATWAEMKRTGSRIPSMTACGGEERSELEDGVRGRP